MAIQTRRGNYADFVPENLLEGEFATVLDRKYVFVGMPNGETVQLGTLEAIQEVLAQAEEFKEDSEAYAVGTRDGSDVPSTDPTYNNNSKYYAQLAQGYMQSATYIFIRYSAYADGTDFTDVPTSTTKYMGVYQGSSSTAPSQKEGYYWSKIKGEQGDQGDQGDTGVGISSISKTSTSGLVDTYTITLTNGNTSTFEVTNGFSPIAHVTKSGSVATFTVTDAHGTTEVEIRDGQDGQGSGDMLKSTYDKNNNGIVDEAEKWANATSIGNGLRVINGVLEATAQTIDELGDIGDVEITNVQNGQVLGYDSVEDKWKNVNAGAGGGGSTIKITTSESALYSQTVTLTDGTTTLTGTFSAGGEATFSNVTMTGNLTATCQSASATFNVPYFGNYSFELSTFTASITVTYPSSTGATCTCSNGTTTLTASASPYTFNVHSTGTWTITTTVDGVSKANDVVITTDGQTESVTVQFGTINVTVESGFVGSTITCSSGGVSMSKTATLTSVVFYPPTIGTWTISGSVSGTPYSVEAVVTDLTVAVSVSLITVPDGSTVTPTDDIQTWLACGGITDKTYTTLSEVLADSTTLAALIADNNAMDYLVRSKTWANDWNDVCTEQTHTFSGTSSTDVTLDSLSGTKYRLVMTAQSSNGAGSGLKLQFYDSNNTALVPNMTSATAPSGTVTQSSQITNYEAWKGFSTSQANGWFAQNSIGYGVNDYIAYEFTSVTSAVKATVSMVNASSTTLKFKIQKYEQSICSNSTAMSYIGLNNYASNTLLADSDWANAIAHSTYKESVLNLKNPTMTSNNQPSGIASAYNTFSTNFQAYYAFDNSSSSNWTGGAGGPTSVSNTQAEIIYQFANAVNIKCIIASFQHNGSASWKVRGSNDGSTWEDLSELQSFATGQQDVIEAINNIANYNYYELYFAIDSQTQVNVYDARFYGRQDV